MEELAFCVATRSNPLSGRRDTFRRDCTIYVPIKILMVPTDRRSSSMLRGDWRVFIHTPQGTTSWAT